MKETEAFVFALSPEQREWLFKAINAADSLLRTNSSHESIANSIGQLLEAVSQIQYFGGYSRLAIRPRVGGNNVFGDSSLVG